MPKMFTNMPNIVNNFTKTGPCEKSLEIPFITLYHNHSYNESAIQVDISRLISL